MQNSKIQKFDLRSRVKRVIGGPKSVERSRKSIAETRPKPPATAATAVVKAKVALAPRPPLKTQRFTWAHLIIDQHLSKVRRKFKTKIMVENCTKCCTPVLEDQAFYACNTDSNLPFHPACLSCQTCQQSFDLSENIYVKGNSVFCYDHYLKQHGPQCQICEEYFCKEDYSVKIGNKFYHPDCLKCTECSATLEKGMICNLEDMLCAEHTNPAKSSPENKKRVPRTKFTQDQVDIMMRVFAQTPRPTRLMREQMAQQTGLEVRCIQIWFQNKRSKEKRMHSKRQYIAPTQTSWYPMPMVPQTTTCHQPMSYGQQPMPVSFPTPPKDTEFYEPPSFDTVCNTDTGLMYPLADTPPY